MTSLKKFRVTAWLYTMGFCWAAFTLSSPLWDGHFHPFAALVGAALVATAISFKERKNDAMEAPLRDACTAIAHLRRQARREEITPTIAREGYRDIVENAPPEYRPALRRVAFPNDDVQALIACREDYEAILRNHEELLADLVETSRSTCYPTTELQERVRDQMAQCRERIGEINTQIDDLTAARSVSNTDR